MDKQDIMDWRIIVPGYNGDYYIIPENRKDDWEKFLQHPHYGTPAYATYAGGFLDNVRFLMWEVKK